MNKLYVVNYRMPNGYLVCSRATWDYYEAKELMTNAPQFKYELVEANAAHMIWEGK